MDRDRHTVPAAGMRPTGTDRADSHRASLGAAGPALPVASRRDWEHTVDMGERADTRQRTPVAAVRSARRLASAVCSSSRAECHPEYRRPPLPPPSSGIARAAPACLPLAPALYQIERDGTRVRVPFCVRHLGAPPVRRPLLAARSPHP